MDTEAVNTAIQTPPPGEVAPPSTEAPVSVAEHAAQFDPKRPEPEPDATSDPQERGERGRYRAKSQKAGPEDVPRIAELTKRLREAERERDEWKTKVSAAPTPPAAPSAPAVTTPQSAAAGFPDKEPTVQDFMDQEDPYAAYLRAMARYDRKREAWEEQQQSVTAQQTAAETAAFERDRQSIVDYRSRLATFESTTPDFRTVTADLMAKTLPGALLKAIATHDKGPEFVYHLAQHPDDVDDIVLAAVKGDPHDDDFVALLQRRLSKLSSPAASIASVTGVPHVPAPRPPNAMRTAPMKTGDDPPADGHSLAEHAKFFGPKRR